MNGTNGGRSGERPPTETQPKNLGGRPPEGDLVKTRLSASAIAALRYEAQQAGKTQAALLRELITDGLRRRKYVRDTAAMRPDVRR